jgi:hypothetical protein
MKDARSVLDGVRAKIPTGAKLLVVWVLPDETGKLGALRCAQANTTMGEIEQIADSLKAQAVMANAGGVKGLHIG